MRRHKEYLLILVFLVISVIGVFRHELSLDESRVWISMESTELSSIVSATRCEMHCLPWFYVVKILTVMTSQPLVMQILAVLIGSFSFALLVLYAPFAFYEKCLFLLNYYLLFEYNLLARPYVLMVSGLFLICFFYPRRKDNPSAYLLAIFVLQNSTFFGIFFGIPLLLLYLIESGKKLNLRIAGTVSALFALSIWYLLPVGKDYNCISLPMESVTMDFKRFAEASWDVARAFFPLTTDTWNEHSFDDSQSLKDFLSAGWWIFVFAVSWSVRKSRNALLFFLSAAILIFSYRFLKPIYFGNFLRHMGSLSVIFIATVWIARVDGVRSRALPVLMLLFLLPSSWSGAKMYVEDFRRNFSEGREVHDFISGREFGNKQLIVDSMLFTSPYLVYSDRKYFSHMDEKEVRYFPLSRDRHQVPVHPAPVRGIHLAPKLPDDILSSIIREEMVGGKAILILNYPADPGFLRSLNLVQERRFSGAINALEDYWIYRREE